MTRSEEARRYRARLKQRRAEDPEFDAECKRKKREEVARYRARQNQRRAEDPEFDAECKRKRREELARYRARKADHTARLEAKLRELGVDPAEI